jgi:hypothetical protein
MWAIQLKIKRYTIMKDNKLIAEFMGFKQPHPEYPNTSYWYKELPNGRLETLAILNYHISWDWLMPVVEKINLLDDYRYTFLIGSMDAQIVDNVTNDVIVEVSCKHSVDELIKSVYDAVVEFIKQHNKDNN